MLEKANDTWTLNEAAHLLNRAGFGGSPNEIQTFHKLGRSQAVDSLLSVKENEQAFPLPAWATEEQAIADARNRAALRVEMQKSIRDMSPEKAEATRREAFKKLQQESRQQALEGQGWWFRRMLKTNDPLRERMTLFWHDHFATSIQKTKQPYLMIKQNALFRTHAFGSFKDLTQEILLDPAMMLYLDTQTSQKGKPNENFAREVMELFTLGEGKYTEQDIREAARAFTGYQINRFNGKVIHNRRKWDETPKTIFGKTGNFDGKGVINMIFEKPDTAPFIARKIWEYFVYENPSEAIVTALANSLRENGYRMAPMLREVFLTKEFYSDAAMRTQIKSPVQFVIQLIKQLEISNPPTGFPLIAQQQLGQVLFMPPNVAGWDWGQAWINTNTLLTRYNLAGFITKGADGSSAMDAERIKTPGMAKAPKRVGRGWKGPDYDQIAPRALRENPTELVDTLIFRFFQGTLPEKARGAFIEYATSKKGVIFTNTEMAELCHLMLSTPYYQLC